VTKHSKLTTKPSRTKYAHAKSDRSQRAKSTRKSAPTNIASLEPDRQAARGTPDPEGLTVVAMLDKKESHWVWTIREGKMEHYAGVDTCESEAQAQVSGQQWLTQYAQADEAERRQMLGWKETSSASPACEAKRNHSPRQARPNSPDSTPTDVPQKGNDDKKLSGLDAAALVLRRAGKPLRSTDLTERMLSQGLWATDGKTPAATISAAIFREIQTKGSRGRFKKAGCGLFAFNAASLSRA